MTGVVRLGKDARWQQKNTADFRRQNNVLFESYKNHYNAYNENKMQKARNNKLKQMLTVFMKHLLREYNGIND